MRVELALPIALAACGYPSFTPPKLPPHEELLDGHPHSTLYKHPFWCPKTQGFLTVGGSCVIRSARPPDDELSCDSIGCHGGYDHRSDPRSDDRHLRGSNGPSCYACHEKNWSDER